LTPAAVAATTTVEQQFTVSGLVAGQLVIVNKPTQQTGLDIGNVRIVSNNVLGITYINFTGAAITPTAETYTVAQFAGMDAINNDVFYGFNAGTVGAIGAGVVITGGATTLTGMLATDMVTGIQQPSTASANIALTTFSDSLDTSIPSFLAAATIFLQTLSFSSSGMPLVWSNLASALRTCAASWIGKWRSERGSVFPSTTLPPGSM
jgi:hypothetical protein